MNSFKQRVLWLKQHYRYVRLVVAVIVFLQVYKMMDMSIPIQCDDCDVEDISDEFKDIYPLLQTGDIITVSSEDFFSRMFMDLGQCRISSSKIVVRDEDKKYERGNIALLISDTLNLTDDKNAIDLLDMVQLLAMYTTSSISVYRPKEMKQEYLDRIDALAKRAITDEHIYYDFAFDNDDKTTFNCDKLLIHVYGDYIKDRWHEASAWLPTALPCHLKWENMEKIVGPIPFWKEESL